MPGADAMHIRVDDLSGPEIRALLEEHLQDMRRISPPESVHALDLDALRQPEITFWTAWADGELVGCGAGRAMLLHIVDEARRRGLARLSLETGSQPEFVPARSWMRPRSSCRFSSGQPSTSA